MPAQPDPAAQAGVGLTCSRRLAQLAGSLVVYGLGDVATSIVGFLLLPVFTSLLTPADYGVLALLTTVEVVAKIVFRWGVDASFMRFYYDCEDDGRARRLAGTIFLFLVGANGDAAHRRARGGTVRVGRASSACPASRWRCSSYSSTRSSVASTSCRFTCCGSGGAPWLFSLANFARTFGTLLLRILFVIGLGRGVMGVVYADTVVTAVFAPGAGDLVRAARPGRAVAAAAPRRAALRPAARAARHRAAGHRPGHRRLSAAALPRAARRRPGSAAIGVYSVHASLGLAMKYFLSAFETAWAPFYFATMKEADAKRTFAGITTYGVAVLVLLAAGLSAVSTDLVRLMTKPDYVAAAGVIPWITVGVVFQGFYLLTSIGLNITKHTEYYPVATAIGAVVNVDGQRAADSVDRRVRPGRRQRRCPCGPGRCRLSLVAPLLPGAARVGTTRPRWRPPAWRPWPPRAG